MLDRHEHRIDSPILNGSMRECEIVLLSVQASKHQLVADGRVRISLQRPYAGCLHQMQPCIDAVSRLKKQRETMCADHILAFESFRLDLFLHLLIA